MVQMDAISDIQGKVNAYWEQVKMAEILARQAN